MHKCLKSSYISSLQIASGNVCYEKACVDFKKFFTKIKLSFSPPLTPPPQLSFGKVELEGEGCVPMTECCQMAAMARAALASSQEPGVSSGSPIAGAGAQALEPSSAASPTTADTPEGAGLRP